MEAKSTSEKQTREIAKDLAKTLKAGDVVALHGDLGAGKTTFIQGLAEGLGIKKRILSPTFVFMRSYPFILKGKDIVFHHIDLYRGESPKDFTVLALDEVFTPDSIVIIEWAEKIKEKLPKRRIDVYIERTNEATRKIKITPPPMSFPRKRESRSWIPDQVQNDNKVSSRLHSNINKTAGILRSGGVVIFPTDTVYGIGCRFDNRQAVNRIYQIKGSPKNQPFPILVSSISQVAKIAHINDLAKRLIKKYWPGGLTIVLPGLSTYFKPGLKQLHKPGLEHAKIGFRMPDSKLVLNLINKVSVPIIGTSANFHGHKTPISFEELDPNFTKLVDYVVRGKCQKGVGSTVIDATTDPPKVLRQGTILIS